MADQACPPITARAAYYITGVSAAPIIARRLFANADTDRLVITSLPRNIADLNGKLLQPLYNATIGMRWNNYSISSFA